MTYVHQEEKQSTRFFRGFTWVVGAAILLAVIFVVAQQFGDVERKETRTVDDLIGQWKAAGLKVGAVDALPDTLGAERAVRVEVSGKPVVVYHFNVADRKQFDTLEQIRATKRAGQGDQQEGPAITDGAFVLAHYQGHPDEDKMVREFKGFGAFEGIKIDEDQR